MAYLARAKDGSSQVYLTKDTQMDAYLERNCNIYFENNDDETETLIATPEDGFLVERPVFPTTTTFTPKAASSDLEQAAAILLGLEV